MKRLLFPLLLFSATSACAAPDLRDAGGDFHIISATGVVAGQSFHFEHLLENIGTTDAGKTVVTYWLSTDNTPGNAGDVNLGEVAVESIPRARPVPAGRLCTVPAGTAPAGNWKLFWSIDPAGDANAANNIGAYGKNLAVTAPPSFDLLDAGAAFRTLSATTMSPGQSFQASAMITNAGPADSPGFYIQYRLSTDATIGDADDIALGTVTDNGLDGPGKGVGSRALDRSLSLPPGQAPGSYRFGYLIVANGDANPANNAVLFSQVVTVPSPPAGSVDLVDAGSGFWELPWLPQVMQGDAVTVGGAIRNLGTVTSGSFNLFFFASTDNTVGDADDIVIPGPHGMPPLVPNVNGLQLASFSVPVPTTLLQPGQAYRFGWTITGGSDGNTANNATLNPTPILIAPRPDMELLTDWTVDGELTDHPWSLFFFAGSTRNNSTASRQVYYQSELRRLRADGSVDQTPHWLAEISSPDLLNGGTFLGSIYRAFTRVDAGQQRMMEFGVPVDRIHRNGLWSTNSDLLPGSYRALISMFDRDTNALLDTHSVPGTVTVARSSRPDLALSHPNTVPGIFPAEAVQPGGTLTIRGVARRNVGAEDSTVTHVRVYANDTPLGSLIAVPAMARRGGPVGEPLGDITVTIPGNFPAGEAVISLRIDPLNLVAEDAEYNNTFTAGTVLVGALPDLREGGAAYRTLPGAVLPGQQGSLQLRVRNAGLGAAGAFAVRFYFSSTEPTEATPMTPLGEVQISSLAALTNQTLTFLFAFPAGTPQGLNHLACRVDALTDVTETVETNNWTLLGTVFAGARPNLLPGTVPLAVSTDEVASDGSFTVTGSRLNNGNLPADAHRMTFIYRSGAEERRNSPAVSALAAGQQLAFSHTQQASGLPVGTWEVGYLVDSWGQVEESDEQDNIVWLDGTLRVVTPVIPGQPPPAPVMLEMDRFKDDIFLRWTSRKGLTYQPQWSTTGSGWRDLGGPLTGVAGGMEQWFLNATTAAQPRMLFRVEQRP